MARRPTHDSSFAVPLSRRTELEGTLDEWIAAETERDDVVVRDERCVVANASKSAARLVARLHAFCPTTDLTGVGKTATEWLRGACLDDLDGEGCAEWLTTNGGLVFVDDRLPLPEEERDAIRNELARVIARAVKEDVGIVDFAARVARVGTDCAKAHGRSRTAFRELEDGLSWFCGVMFIREPAEQHALVDQLMGDFERLLNVRWVARPRPARRYSPQQTFDVGDTIDHPKFGVGEVVARVDGNVRVRFGEETRTLATRK